MAHKSDAEMIEKGSNTARFFVEHRQIAWILLIGTVLWGWYGYNSMPQRKDPDIPVRVAVAITPWPGVRTQQVEQLVTRPIEEKIAENSSIHPGTAADYGIRSITLPGLSIVYVQLAENVNDSKKQFSDINLKLNALNSQLPQGAGPIQFQSDFGDTAALMLTIASPRLSDVEIAIRARSIRKAVEEARASISQKSSGPRVAALYCFPESVSPDAVRSGFDSFSQEAQHDGIFRDARVFARPGFIGLDGNSSRSDAEIQAYIAKYIRQRVHASEFHPDAWGPILIRDTSEAGKKVAAMAGDKYSYRELDDFTDLIARTLIGTPQASKYQRAGVWPEQVYLDYSQDRLASYGVQLRSFRISCRRGTSPYREAQSRSQARRTSSWTPLAPQVGGSHRRRHHRAIFFGKPGLLAGLGGYQPGLPNSSNVPEFLHLAGRRRKLASESCGDNRNLYAIRRADCKVW